MPFYRFYLLTANDHIALRREANCDNDAHAIVKAAEIIGRHPAIEVWHEGRRVIRLAAVDLLGHDYACDNHASARLTYPLSAITKASTGW